jgi:hypothetical protein
MMGWMAPLRHLSAKLLSDRISSEMGAIHGRGYYDRIGLGEACNLMSLGNRPSDSQETFGSS